MEGSTAGAPSLEDDSVSGYTETSPVTEQENTTTDIVPMAQEQEEEISLLEKILMELAAHQHRGRNPGGFSRQGSAMSETNVRSTNSPTRPAKRTPTVYFIDDSATMREVIKIAFRRESINVITCADAASALGQFEQTPPDVVITDVIMPDQDGYSVCTQIKQHDKFSHIPVILMSGVVNKTVADKAVSVKADELIRKPFQPQELIGRVKTLLNPKSAAPPSVAPERPTLPGLSQPPAPTQSPATLSSLFAPPPPQQVPQPHVLQLAPSNATANPAAPESAWPRALADAFTPAPVFANQSAQDSQSNPPAQNAARPSQPAYPSHPGQPSHGFPGQQSNPGYPSHTAQPPAQSPARTAGPDAAKLRAEIARLDLLVKKLQTELQIERQYNQALEAQLQALTRSE